MSGKKDDKGKAPIIQGCLNYFPRALEAVAMQSKYGLEKYSLKYEDKNFLLVDNAVARYTDAMGRHQLGEVNDWGSIDPESGMHHAVAVAWNALARLESILLEEEKETSMDQAIWSLEEDNDDNP